MTSKSNGLGALFAGATQDGGLSKGALAAININDIGDEINNALGVSVDDVTSSEVVLVSGILDDSSSIHDITDGPQLVRDGHNSVIDALRKTKQRDGILVTASLLNRGLVYPYTAVDKSPLLDDKNYRASGGTPLYDKSIVLLGTVIAKSQEFLNNGIACRSVSYILTDGADFGSRKSAKDVQKVVRDMLKMEKSHHRGHRHCGRLD
jgi:hypothetical protein